MEFEIKINRDKVWDNAIVTLAGYHLLISKNKTTPALKHQDKDSLRMISAIGKVCMLYVYFVFFMVHHFGNPDELFD